MTPGAREGQVWASAKTQRPSRARIWRAAVEEGSMRPTIEPGDWLLLDPTIARWPRRGSIVVVREPGSELLAIKRVAGRPGDFIAHEHPSAEGGATVSSGLRLGRGEAWLLGDARDVSIDSRRYGPVPLERLVARAWFRYWPPSRIGHLRPVRRTGTPGPPRTRG